MKILIRGGRVINPAAGTDEIADVLIAEDKVAGIRTGDGNILWDGPKEAESDADRQFENADRVIDAKGKFVMPGFVDLHVHFRDPGLTHKEDVITGMAAAAKGGYTSVFAMPNTKPVADCADVIAYVQDKAKEQNCIHVYQVGAVTKGQRGEELADIAGMVRAGCRAISEDGKSVMNADLYRDGMREAARLNIPVFAHCEDINMVHGGVMNADEHAEELGLSGITNAVEDVIVARDILLSKETKAQLHLCHCSTEDSVWMVQQAKNQGLSVTAEVCPHHFALTSQDIPKQRMRLEGEAELSEEMDADTNYKMNPPLRTDRDVAALKEGLRDGIIDAISTDHAPHAEEEKNTSMKKAPFGIVGLETAAALTYTELVRTGYLTPVQMAEKMSYNPAKIAHLNAGDISPGHPADIVIFDPDETYAIDKFSFVSKGRNTPFHGRKVTGSVIGTICGGRIVYVKE